MTATHRAAIAAVLACATLSLATPVSAQLGLVDVLPLDPAMAGPDLLRAPSPRAPQLENTGIWRAAPIMVCHASAYRAGEYLHQGCVYDDQGAQLVPTNWPEHSITFAYRYPTAEAYRQNAADLLEVRVKPLADATAIRITYNTMLDPSLIGTTIALGSSAQPRPAPYGANTAMPAQRFVTVRGTVADVVDAATGQVLAVAPTVTVDTTRRQIEVRVPYAAFDPRGQTAARMAVAAGAWDSAANRFLIPQVGNPTSTKPGGAVAGDLKPSAYFDVAFRAGEPFDSPWRNDLQKQALAAHDISRFYASIDFVKLAAGSNDELVGKPEGAPPAGFMNRLYATQHEVRQGRRLPADPGAPPLGSFTQQNSPTTLGSGTPSLQFGWVCRDDCVPDLPGQIQRYLAYVPQLPAPASGYATLLWTGGYAQSANDQVEDPGYGQAFPAGDKDLFRQFANRTNAPTVVIAVDARGADNWAYGRAGASVFEALADARRAFKLDAARTVMAGFSSGAYSANKLSLQFPDVFSKAFICDGLNEAPSFPGINGIADTTYVDTATQHEPGSRLTPLLPSRRNQPVLEWAGLPDNYIPYNIPRERADAYLAGDYDYAFMTWQGASSDHVVMCANGTWGVATRWLGDMRGVPDIFHVTYVRNPAWDDPQSGLIGNKAYWLSGIEARSTDRTLPGTIDVVSRGFGLADAPKAPMLPSAGLEPGTTIPLNAYIREQRNKPAPLPALALDRLDITARNIATVTIDRKRARVSCNAALNVDTDGPLTVRMSGCGQDRVFP
jgi:hypothetical protein